MEALQRYEKDEAVLGQVRDTPEQLANPRLRAMLLYARKLSIAPATMDAAGVAALRDAGLADAGVLRINLVTAYFNFVNRIALGLGMAADAQEIARYRNERAACMIASAGAARSSRNKAAQRYSGFSKSNRLPASQARRWLPWAGMPPCVLSIRARCIRFQVMKVVLRLVKSFSGPPDPSSR